MKCYLSVSSCCSWLGHFPIAKRPASLTRLCSALHQSNSMSAIESWPFCRLLSVQLHGRRSRPGATEGLEVSIRVQNGVVAIAAVNDESLFDQSVPKERLSRQWQVLYEHCTGYRANGSIITQLAH